MKPARPKTLPSSWRKGNSASFRVEEQPGAILLLVWIDHSSSKVGLLATGSGVGRRKEWKERREKGRGILYAAFEANLQR